MTLKLLGADKTYYLIAEPMKPAFQSLKVKLGRSIRGFFAVN